MNQPASPLWTTNTSEVRITGTWRSAIPHYRTAPSPCHGACPVSGEIARWIQQLSDGDHQKAWLTLVENNPFPAIAGRICHHPCESSCNRQHLDETVGICNLERFIGDMALSEKWSFPVITSMTGKSVAIVGSGPAGLSAAYQLRRKGYQVALYEAQQQLGGLMRYGIPAYRLEKKVLDGEIQRIIDMGVEVHLNSAINCQQALLDLKGRYDGVFLATGATLSKALPNLDYKQNWVMDSADFLASTNGGKDCELGDRLLVIGGGSAAIDVARTARRLGKLVTILSLEPDNLLPAQQEEVNEAKEEGVTFVTAAMMKNAEYEQKGLTIHCVKVNFKKGKTAADFSVEAIEDSEFILSADAIIPAIGQDVDIALWNGLLENSGVLIKTDAHWQTTVPGIFAGGDMATMNRFVTEAIGIGKEAAKAIDRYIKSEQDEMISAAEPEVPFSVINTYYHPLSKQHHAANSDIFARLSNFNEVQQPLDQQAAMAESKRCFSCGSCTYCDSCFFHCPDMAITKLDKGYEIKTDYCKGCGLCVAECPTGSIIMRQETT